MKKPDKQLKINFQIELKNYIIINKFPLYIYLVK